MSAYRYCLIVFICTAVLCNDKLMAKGSNSFAITPDGLPALRIRLCRAADCDCFGELELVHELTYDGDHYRSRLYFPFFQSTFTILDNGLYLWRSPSGSNVALKPDENVTASGRWRVKRLENIGFCVEDLVGAVLYYYCDGRLIRIKCRHIEVCLRYKNGRLECIEMGEEVMKLCWREGIPEFDVCLAGKLLEVRMSADNFRVMNINLDGENIGIEYDNDLLRAINHSGIVRQFDWDIIHTRAYAKSPLPPRPVVIYDGVNNYKYSLRGGRLRVDYENRQGEWAGTGYWYYDIKTNRIDGVIVRSGLNVPEGDNETHKPINTK